MIIPFLRTQTELLTGIRQRLRDATANRWQDSEVYNALNDALLRWHGRVMIPLLYTVPSGWSSNQYDYSLPSYIHGPIDPQQKRYGYTLQTSTWEEMNSFSVEPDGAGGQTLRLQFYPTAGDGRIIWWSYNGPLPTIVSTLSATISSSDTSLALATKPTIGDSGYIKIDSEWMQYAGVTEGASTLTLSNLERAVNGTTAASHTGGVNVVFGVAAHRADLFQQLYDQALADLHALPLHNTSDAERAHHERLMVFYQERADNYWRKYAPARKPKIRLDRVGTGDIPPTDYGFWRRGDGW